MHAQISAAGNRSRWQIRLVSKFILPDFKKLKRGQSEFLPTDPSDPRTTIPRKPVPRRTCEPAPDRQRPTETDCRPSRH